MRPGGSNRHVEPMMVPLIKGMLDRGDLQQDIAAFFGLNSGRIAEINTGQKHADVPAVSANLPPPGPYLTPYALWRARVALEQVHLEVDTAAADFEREVRKLRTRVATAVRIAGTEMRRAELG